MSFLSCLVNRKLTYRLYCLSSQIPKGFWWLKQGKLAGLAKPKTKSDLELLKNNGVTHLVSLTETLPDLHGVDIESVHMPVPGGGIPTVQQAHEFYDIVEKVGANGGAVALHCGEGQGRASVLMACYAVKSFALPAEEAIKKVRQERPGAVATQERQNRVKEYEDSLKK